MKQINKLQNSIKLAQLKKQESKVCDEIKVLDTGFGAMELEELKERYPAVLKRMIDLTEELYNITADLGQVYLDSKDYDNYGAQVDWLDLINNRICELKKTAA